MQVVRCWTSVCSGSLKALTGQDIYYGIMRLKGKKNYGEIIIIVKINFGKANGARSKFSLHVEFAHTPLSLLHVVARGILARKLYIQFCQKTYQPYFKKSDRMKSDSKL